MKKIILAILIIQSINPLFAQINTKLKIIEKPIIYNKQRDSLSLQYLKDRHGLIQKRPTIKPKIIVLHYTAGGTLQSNFNYFNQVLIENARQINKDQSILNVSAHYLVDRDGSIYHLMPDTFFARHTIGLNYCAIGVENIGSKLEPLTAAQVIANANLVKHLCSKYKIEYLIGHSEYLKFRTTNLWKETNKNYITYKEDPGTNFMIAVRKLITDLKLKEKP